MKGPHDRKRERDREKRGKGKSWKRPIDQTQAEKKEKKIAIDCLIVWISKSKKISYAPYNSPFSDRIWLHLIYV